MKDGGSAFPYSPHTGNAGDDVPGMSLRDYFAAAALTGLLAHNCDHFTPDDLRADDLSRRSYICADEMLAQREKKNQ